MKSESSEDAVVRSFTWNVPVDLLYIVFILIEATGKRTKI